MNTDSYFEIGSSHIVCEDYTLSGTMDGELSYAILCDGCSSSNHTDLGARLLAHIAKDVILYLNRRKVLHIDNKDFHSSLGNINALFQELILKKISEVKSSLCLSSETFDATLLIALAIGPHVRKLMSWGDGYFIIKRKPPVNATVYGMELISTEFVSGAPYYLSYGLSHDRSTGYFGTFGSDSVLRHNVKLTNSSLGITEVKYTSRTLTIDTAQMYLSLYNGTIENSEDYFQQPISQIILASDGLGTYRKGQDNLHIYSLLPDFVDYKNPKGEFVQRRMRNTIAKEHREQKITHYDDISFAVINLI